MAGQEERNQENQSTEGGSGWGVLALSCKPLSKWGPISAPPAQSQSWGGNNGEGLAGHGGTRWSVQRLPTVAPPARP